MERVTGNGISVLSQLPIKGLVRRLRARKGNADQRPDVTRVRAMRRCALVVQ